MPFPIRFAVVSLPATSSTRSMSRASSGVIRSPRLLPRANTLMMSSRGSARRASMIGAKISSIAWAAALAPARSLAVTVNSSSRARCFDKTSKRLRLSGGTPSIQVMTRRGSGCATSPDEIEARRRGDALQQLRSDGPYPAVRAPRPTGV